MDDYEPKNLRRWIHPDHYVGEVWPNYYSAGVGRSRDSSLLEESNFEVLLKRLGGESETVVVVRESHWAVGWVEWIAIHQDDAKALRIADEANEELEDYLVLDEEDWSNREWNAQCDSWQYSSMRERVEICKDCGISIFAARRDELPECDTDALRLRLIGQ